MSRPPLRLAAVLPLLALAAGTAAGKPPPVPRPYLTEPALSPDGTEIVFVSGGDLWSVPAAGGEARLLVAHPATESRPCFSPDGTRLAFGSTRTGNGDLYVLALATGELKRVTFDDANDQLDGWSGDGRWLYFFSSGRDIAGMNDVYRVAAGGGTPVPLCADRYANEYFSALAPDGGLLAFTARGTSAASWWRRGHSHLDECEIWLRHPGPRFERFTPPRPQRGAKELWPMWAPDGRRLYYVSDRDGAPNLWSRELGGEPRRLTSFREGRLLWPSIGRDGRAIVFERDFGIWKWSTGGGDPAPVPITLRGTASGAGVERLSLTSGFGGLALARDGKKLAFTAGGEVFAAAATGGDARRVSRNPGPDAQPVWSPDSRRLVYVSERDGARRLVQYDFAAGTETLLTHGSLDDDSPAFSPDGRRLAFYRDGRELWVLEPATGSERLLLAAPVERAPFVSAHSLAWSPDSRWLAVIVPGPRGFRNVRVVPAAPDAGGAGCRPEGTRGEASGEARQVSFLAHTGSNSVSWSSDGRSILFGTGQRTEPYFLARIDLVPRAPRFREDAFDALFPAPAPGGGTPGPPRDPEPVRIRFDDIRRRLTLLPLGIDVNDHTVSPDGRNALITATAGGQQQIFLYSLDDQPGAAPRLLVSGPGGKSDAQFSPDGREVYYLEAGRLQVAPVETRQPPLRASVGTPAGTRAVTLTAELESDFHQTKVAVFRQAWTYLRDHFYDPGFHGVSWGAVRDTYQPLAAGARNPDELRRLLLLMVGELNASHLGAFPPGTPAATAGRLGVELDASELESTGRHRVRTVLPGGPAALAGGVQSGDYLLEVEDTPLAGSAGLDALLEHRVGRRVRLKLSASPDGAASRTVAVRPITRVQEKALIYRQWVEERREHVTRASGGRLGYLHMPDMSQASLNQLHADLDAENQERDGVVLDLRANSGGFVNAYALDVLARRPYLMMARRGQPAVPARGLLGQRALERPTVLLVNQHSLSDAEDFTEGYRRLKLGKVVGEKTAGWIIFTSDVPLLDGTMFRLPGTRITTAEGEDMENHPRPVDVRVERPIGESYTGGDRQLDRAVRELLEQLGP